MAIHARLSKSLINLTESIIRQPIPKKVDETQKSTKHEVFVGNLRYDVSTRFIIDKLQELCQTIKVQVPDFRFTVFARKSKRYPIKYAFVMLENENEEKLVQQLNGTENLDIVISGRKLKVQIREDTTSKYGKGISPSAEISVPKKPTISKSDPDLTSNDQSKDSRISIDSKPYNKSFCFGQLLPCEDRVTEYKRGSGLFLKKSLVPTIRKYICAFLNSEGGHLMIGVDDNCKVYGVCCDREEEDLARCQIDNTIKQFQPHVLPISYVVDFIPVKLSVNDDIEPTTRDSLLKVLEVSVKRPVNTNVLYENDRGQVFVRRDGSIEGPLKATQIVEWCRIQFWSRNQEHHNRDKNDNRVIARESYTTLQRIEKLEDRCAQNQRRIEDKLETIQSFLFEKQNSLLQKLEKKENDLVETRRALADKKQMTVMCTIL